MGAKDTFPSRFLSLSEANEVEPLFYFPLNEWLVYFRAEERYMVLLQVELER